MEILHIFDSTIRNVMRPVALNIVCTLHRLWKWYFPSGNIRSEDSVCYERVSHRALVGCSYFPFVRLIVKDFRRTEVESHTHVRAYPVVPSGAYHPKGRFTILHVRGLPPPKSVPILVPILSASLLDQSTRVEVDVTEQVIRLAGPRHDFFGFEYPLGILKPWLCDCTGMKSNEHDLILKILLDVTFEVHTFKGDELVLPIPKLIV